MNLAGMSDVLNLVASNQPGVASQAQAMKRKQTLDPIKLNNKAYLEIQTLGLNASSFTTVHLVATVRDNSVLDNFGHGQRHLRVCKRICTKDATIREAAKRELEIYRRLNEDEGAGRRMIQLVDHSAEQSENELTLLMEYGGGGTLEEWQPEDAQELIGTCATMLRCLGWLHGLRVVHLDIKPANFVFVAGRLKLIDFGVARELESSDGVLKLDAPFPGSMDYQAPEAITGRSPALPIAPGSITDEEAEAKLTFEVSTKTDIWAFGCLVCKLGTGSTPFPPCLDRDEKGLANQRKVLALALRMVPRLLAVSFDQNPVRGIGDVTEQLVSLCVISSPSERPSAEELLSGQLFQPPTATIKPVAARQVSVSANRRVPPMRRQVTFTAVNKLDLLFHIFAFADNPKRILAARGVCKSWKERIDTSNGEEWRILLQAFFPELNMSAFLPEGFNWKQFVSINSTLTDSPLMNNSPNESISEETLNQVLADMRLAGKLAVCDLNVSFKCILSLRLGTKAKFFDFVYTVCTQKPPHNWTDVVYNWWCQTVQQLSQTIQVTLADAPHARKEAACASFDSFVKLICKALAYLNRFYVQRMNLAPLEQVASPEQAALRQAFGI